MMRTGTGRSRKKWRRRRRNSHDLSLEIVMMMMKLVMARKLVPIGIRIPIDDSRQTDNNARRARTHQLFFFSSSSWPNKNKKTRRWNSWKRTRTKLHTSPPSLLLLLLNHHLHHLLVDHHSFSSCIIFVRSCVHGNRQSGKERWKKVPNCGGGILAMRPTGSTSSGLVAPDRDRGRTVSPSPSFFLSFILLCNCEARSCSLVFQVTAMLGGGLLHSTLLLYHHHHHDEEEEEEKPSLHNFAQHCLSCQWLSSLNKMQLTAFNV